MDGHQRQKEQSRRMIEEALFMLMDKKDYAQITVSEIVRKADVSRRTFYRLYGEKDEVLRGYFGRLCREYQSEMPALASYDIARVAGDYFKFWYGHKKFLLLMHKRRLDEMLYHEIACAAVDVVRSRIGEVKERRMEELEYFADYSAGGFALLLMRWVETGMNEPPKQYADKVSEGLLRFMQGLP